MYRQLTDYICYCSVDEEEQAWRLRQLGFRLALLVLVYSDAVPSLYEMR